MELFELIKREYLVFALDEPFELYRLVMYEWNGRALDPSDIRHKTLELVKYLLESGLFQVEDYDANGGDCVWRLSLDEVLLRVRELWGVSEDNLWRICFGLTQQGVKEAAALLLRYIHAKEQVLVHGKQKRILSLKDIVDLVKNAFDTIDLDVIQVELRSVVCSLVYSNLARMGFLRDGVFNEWDDQGDLAFYKIMPEWQALGREPEEGELMWFKNTLEGNEIVERWQREGGRLVEGWYEGMEEEQV